MKGFRCFSNLFVYILRFYPLSINCTEPAFSGKRLPLSMHVGLSEEGYYNF